MVEQDAGEGGTTVCARLLEIGNVVKRFGSVTALSDVSFDLRQGEIHALLGANGAGKSTLVKILSGVFPPDRGNILLDGRPVSFASPSAAAAAGAATVFQELSLFPNRTVAENVLAGREPRRFGLIDRPALRRAARSVLERVGLGLIDLDQTVGDLSLADRQLIEIAKALSHAPRVLILDEATSALARTEVRRLFSLLRRLREEGLGIIFISHRMPEIRALADRVTVLRDGRDVMRCDITDFDEANFLGVMLGQEARTLTRGYVGPRPTGAAAMEISGLSVPGRLHDIDLTLTEGEIVGLAGLDGQGQGDLLEALFGTYGNLRGDIRIAGKPVSLRAPWQARRAGVALVPLERKTAGVILPFSVRENLALPNLVRLSRGALIDRRAEAQETARLTRELMIKTDTPDTAVGKLSGGNQQKVAIGKWVGSMAKVYLFHDPTRGIDIAAKAAVHDVIRSLARRGCGVILYSSENEELVGLCHRVAVMDRGRIETVLEEEAITDEGILRATVGLGSSAPAGEVAA